MTKSIKKEALSEESVESILSEIDSILGQIESNDVDVDRIFEAMGKMVSKRVSQKLQ